MASEAFVRGDVLAHRGTPLIDDALDMCPNNVGGHIVAIPFTGAITGGDTGVNAAFAGSTVTKFIPHKTGSIIGLSIYGNAAVTLGHVTATVYNGATAYSTFTVNLTTGATFTRTDNDATVKDTYAFAAGDVLGLKLDCAATNTANSVGVTLFVEM